MADMRDDELAEFDVDGHDIDAMMAAGEPVDIVGPSEDIFAVMKHSWFTAYTAAGASKPVITASNGSASVPLTSLAVSVGSPVGRRPAATESPARCSA